MTSENWMLRCESCRGWAHGPTPDAARVALTIHECGALVDQDRWLVTVEVSVSEPPKVTWVPRWGLPRWATQSARFALGAMLSAREEPWREAVEQDWVRRRNFEADRVVAQMEEVLRRPELCPRCGERFTTRGIKRHLAACRYPELPPPFNLNEALDG